MKKLIIALCMTPLFGISQTKNVAAISRYIYANEIEYSSTSTISVSEKLVNSFLSAFPLAENVNWHQDTKGYFVGFTQSGIFCKAAYNSKGEFIYALRYYNEANLPLPILLTVRKKFADKKIVGVTELSTADNITYHLKLEDAKKCYGIAVTSSGNIILEEQFEKIN